MRSQPARALRLATSSWRSFRVPEEGGIVDVNFDLTRRFVNLHREVSNVNDRRRNCDAIFVFERQHQCISRPIVVRDHALVNRSSVTLGLRENAKYWADPFVDCGGREPPHCCPHSHIPGLKARRAYQFAIAQTPVSIRHLNSLCLVQVHYWQTMFASRMSADRADSEDAPS